MEDIEHYDIPVYNFPYDVEEDDEETIQDNSELRVFYAPKSRTHFPNQSFRHSCYSPSLALKRRLKLTANSFVQEYTRGGLPRSTIQSTPTSAAYEVLCSGKIFIIITSFDRVNPEPAQLSPRRPEIAHS